MVAKEYRYKIIDMQGDVEFATTVDCIRLMQLFNSPCDYMTEEEDRAVLEGGWSRLFIGPEDERYEIAKLDEHYVEDKYGEIKPVSVVADEEEEREKEWGKWLY